MKKDQKWSKAGGIWAGSCHRGQSPLKLSHIGLRTPCSLSITQITILTSLVLQCAQYHYFDRLLADRQHKRPKITNKLQCGRVVLPWSDLMKYFDQRLQFTQGSFWSVWALVELRPCDGGNDYEDYQVSLLDNKLYVISYTLPRPLSVPFLLARLMLPSLLQFQTCHRWCVCVCFSAAFFSSITIWCHHQMRSKVQELQLYVEVRLAILHHVKSV